MTLDRPPSRVFSAVHQCIYCGETRKTLTKEHIVPLGLGGNLILPKASCLKCASTINSYETVTLQTTLGPLRRRLSFPSRHKKNQPKEVEIGIIKPDGTTGRMKVPVTEYPVGVALPGYNRANIFYGSPPHIDTLGHVGQKFYLNGDMDAFIKKYRWDGMLQLKWLPVQFGQMIIKICFSYAIAELGLNAFSPICLDHILKRDMNISHIFGQNGINDQQDGISNVWNLQLGLFVSAKLGVLLIVYCSIFPGGGTPIYEVVVGRISDVEHLQKWEEMIRSKQCTIEIPVQMPAHPTTAP